MTDITHFLRRAAVVEFRSDPGFYEASLGCDIDEVGG
jgi:hypothetical protein